MVNPIVSSSYEESSLVSSPRDVFSQNPIPLPSDFVESVQGFLKRPLELESDSDENRLPKFQRIQDADADLNQLSHLPEALIERFFAPAPAQEAFNEIPLDKDYTEYLTACRSKQLPDYLKLILPILALEELSTNSSSNGMTNHFMNSYIPENVHLRFSKDQGLQISRVGDTFPKEYNKSNESVTKVRNMYTIGIILEKIKACSGINDCKLDELIGLVTENKISPKKALPILKGIQSKLKKQIQENNDRFEGWFLEECGRLKLSQRLEFVIYILDLLHHRNYGFLKRDLETIIPENHRVKMENGKLTFFYELSIFPEKDVLLERYIDPVAPKDRPSSKRADMYIIGESLNAIVLDRKGLKHETEKKLKDLIGWMKSGNISHRPTVKETLKELLSIQEKLRLEGK
jgi:hypothetical protein